MHGLGMGRAGASQSVRMFQTVGGSTAWVADTSVWCMSAQTAHGCSRVTLTSGEATTSVSDISSMDIAELTAVGKPNHGCSGSASLTIRGANIGLTSYTVAGEAGHTECEQTSWQSDSAVSCSLGQGTMGTRRATISAGVRLGTVSESVSADMTAASFAWIYNGASTGAVAVSMHGADMAPFVFSPSARLGHSACEQTDWSSDTCVLCSATQAMGRSGRTVATVGERVSSSSEAFSAMTGAVSLSLPSNSAATGSRAVTVYGMGLGLESVSLFMRLGVTTCSSSAWYSDTSLVCLGSAGTHSSSRLSVTAGRIAGSATSLLSVEVTLMSASRVVNFGGTGSLRLTVQGANAGLASLSASVRPGTTASETTQWSSDSSLQALSGHGGAWASRAVLVSAGQQTASLSSSLSASEGLLSASHRHNGASSGSTIFTLLGGGMGTTSISAAARTGSASEVSVWESDTSVGCRPGQGTSRSWSIQVTAGARVGSASVALSAASLWASAVTSSNGATTGSVSLTVGGGGLGSALYTAAVRAGITECWASVWLSDTAVLSLATDGLRGSARLVLTSGTDSGSSTLLLSIGPAQTSLVLTSNLASTASLCLTVLGAGFGLTMHSAGGRTSPTSSEETLWTADSFVVGRVGYGTLRSMRMSHTVGTLVGTTSEALSVASTLLSTVTLSNSASTGSASLTVHGQSLALGSFSVSSRTGSSACERSTWVSDTSMWCRQGRLTAASIKLLITSGLQSGSVSSALSADAGRASAASRGNTVGTGSVSITLLGAGMAPSMTYRASVGAGSAIEATGWTSDSSTQCRSTAQGQGSRQIVLTAGLNVHSRTTVYSADLMRTSGLSRVNLAATGSTSMSVYSAGIGRWDASSVARVDGSSCEVTTWVSDTALVCLDQAGQSMMASLRVVITATTSAGSVSVATSIDVLGLSSAMESNRMTTGSRSLTVVGDHMALRAVSATGRIGGTGLEASLWVSDTAMICRLGRMLLGSRSTTVTGGVAAASVTSLLSVDAPAVSTTMVSNRPATGSLSLTVQGMSIGAVASVGMRIAMSACEQTSWTSDTSALCNAGRGTSGSRQTVLTSQGQLASFTDGVSVDGWLTVSGPRLNLAATGSSLVTAYGAGMGAAGKSAAMGGGSTACERTVWEADTSTVCQVGQGSMGSLRVAVTSGSSVSSVSVTLSFGAAAVSVTKRANGMSTGSLSISVHGRGLGTWDASSRGAAGDTGCEESAWTSDSCMRCLVGPATDSSRRLLVSAGVNAGSSSAVYSLDSGAMSATSSVNRPATGALSVTVYGAGAGVGYLSLSMGVGRSACPGTVWISDTSMLCLGVDGARGTRLVTVTAGARIGSASQMYSTDAGWASGMQAVNGATSGAASVTLYGSSWWRAATSATARVDFTGCEDTMWLADSSVVCKSGHRLKASLRVTLTSGGQGVGSLTQMASADGASASVLLRANVASSGSAVVTVHGLGMGRAFASLKSRLGETSSISTIWISVTSTWCKSSSGQRGSFVLSLSIGGQISSGSGLYSYSVTSLSCLAGTNAPLTGSNSFTIYGAISSLASLTGNVRFDGTACQETSWISCTSVSCRTGQIFLGSRPVFYSVSLRTGTVTYTLSADQSQLSLYESFNRARTGSSTLTVIGIQAELGMSLAGRFRGSACEMTFWSSDTAVACIYALANGPLGTHKILVTAGNRMGSASIGTSVDGSMVCNINQVNHRATGSGVLTLTGANMGSILNSLTARVSITASECTLWISDTSMVLRIEAGIQRSRIYSLTSGTGPNQAGSYSQSFSVDIASLSVAGRMNTAASGSVIFTVSGTSIGFYDSTLKARQESSACERTLWNSETTLRCSAGNGVYYTMKLVVTYPGGVSSVSILLTYNLAYASTLVTSNTPITSSTYLTVQGLNFGVLNFCSFARSGRTDSEETLWLSDTSLYCSAGLALSWSKPFVLTTNGYTSSESNANSVDLVLLSYVFWSNRPITAATTLTLSGNLIGLTTTTVFARIAGTACENTIWQSETSLFCPIGSGGLITNRVVMTAGSRPGSMTWSIKTDLPVLSVAGLFNRASTGSAILTLFGLNLGALEITPGRMSRVCLTGSEASLWISDTHIQSFFAEGTRSIGSLRIDITANNVVGTSSQLLSFDGQQLVNVALNSVNGAQTGACRMTLYGDGIGVASSSLMARILASATKNTIWHSDSAVQVMCTGSSDLTWRLIALTSGAIASTLSDAVSYNSGSVSNPSSLWANSPPTGTLTRLLIVNGANFGLADPTLRCMVGISKSSVTIWVSDSAISCLITRGLIKSVNFLLSLQSSFTATYSSAITFDIAEISSLLPGNFPVNLLAERIGLSSWAGQGFDTMDTSPMARFCMTAVQITLWAADTAIIGLLNSQTAPGQSATVILTSGTRGSSSATELFSNDMSIISSVLKTNSAASGLVSAIVAGYTIGCTDFTARVRLGGCVGIIGGGSGPCGGTACESTLWVSDSSLTCTVPKGLLPVRQFAISAGANAATVSQIFSFDKQNVTSAAFPNSTGPTSIGTWVTLSGSSFDWSSQVRVGLSACRTTLWTSDSMLRCKLASGIYNASTVIIATVERIAVTVGSLFTYDKSLVIQYEEDNLYIMNMNSIGNESKFLEIATLPWYQGALSLQEAQIVAAAEIKLVGGFGNPCNASTPLMSIPGLVLKTVVGVRYGPGFGIELETFRPIPAYLEKAVVISPFFKVIAVNLSNVDVDDVRVILGGFPITPQRRALQGMSCENGKEWRMTELGKPLDYACNCPANSMCSGETDCTIYPVVNNTWVVVEVNSSLCSSNSDEGLVIGLTVGLLLLFAVVIVICILFKRRKAQEALMAEAREHFSSDQGKVSGFFYTTADLVFTSPIANYDNPLQRFLLPQRISMDFLHQVISNIPLTPPSLLHEEELELAAQDSNSGPITGINVSHEDDSESFLERETLRQEPEILISTTEQKEPTNHQLTEEDDERACAVEQPEHLPCLTSVQHTIRFDAPVADPKFEGTGVLLEHEQSDTQQAEVCLTPAAAAGSLLERADDNSALQHIENQEQKVRFTSIVADFIFQGAVDRVAQPEDLPVDTQQDVKSYTLFAEDPMQESSVSADLQREHKPFDTQQQREALPDSFVTIEHADEHQEGVHLNSLMKQVDAALDGYADSFSLGRSTGAKHLRLQMMQDTISYVPLSADFMVENADVQADPEQQSISFTPIAAGSVLVSQQTDEQQAIRYTPLALAEYTHESNAQLPQSNESEVDTAVTALVGYADSFSLGRSTGAKHLRLQMMQDTISYVPLSADFMVENADVQADPEQQSISFTPIAAGSVLVSQQTDEQQAIRYTPLALAEYTHESNAQLPQSNESEDVARQMI